MLQLAGLEMPGYNQFLMNLKEQLQSSELVLFATKMETGMQMMRFRMITKLMTDYNILEYNNQFEKKDVIESLFTLK